MNSRLERLKVTIAKCEKIEEIFAKHRVRGTEPTHYDDVIAGFDTPARSGFLLRWDLVVKGSAGHRENLLGREPTCIEISLSGGERGDRLIILSYLPETRGWTIEGSTDIGLDGIPAIRNLAADCRLSAGEERQIGEDEAMKIIATLAVFYKSQPVG
ncbi:MAG: hypothetical protein WC445_01565 [Patescibacteria group bacterium]